MNFPEFSTSPTRTRPIVGLRGLQANTRIVRAEQALNKTFHNITTLPNLQPKNSIMDLDQNPTVDALWRELTETKEVAIKFSNLRNQSLHTENLVEEMRNQNSSLKSQI